jgi:hypothetical protein
MGFLATTTAADCCCLWIRRGHGVLGVVFGLAVTLLAGGNAVVVVSIGSGVTVVVVTGFLVIAEGFLVVPTGFIPLVDTGFLVVEEGTGFLVDCWTLGLGRVKAVEGVVGFLVVVLTAASFLLASVAAGHWGVVKWSYWGEWWVWLWCLAVGRVVAWGLAVDCLTTGLLVGLFCV